MGFRNIWDCVNYGLVLSYFLLCQCVEINRFLDWHIRIDFDTNTAKNIIFLVVYFLVSKYFVHHMPTPNPEFKNSEFFKVKSKKKWLWNFVIINLIPQTCSIATLIRGTSVWLGSSECIVSSPKGQLIWKCLFEKIVWTKIPTKNLIDSAQQV